MLNPNQENVFKKNRKEISESDISFLLFVKKLCYTNIESITGQ